MTGRYPRPCYEATPQGAVPAAVELAIGQVSAEVEGVGWGGGQLGW
jgi:hypothetical protein